SNTGKSGTIDRKTIEKNRRIQMKALCFKLVSLITPNSSTIVPQKHSSNKDVCKPQIVQFDNAAAYIQELRKRIDELKRKKQGMIHGGEQEIISINSSTSTSSSSSTSTMTGTNLPGANLPILEVKDFEDAMVVVVVTGLNKNFMFYELITILEEHGAEVVSASFATVSDKVYHTIHSQVRCSRLGVETTKICDRLKKLVYA
ncbi:transcription factor bHLH162-like, partial [Papaver somniferum]|uniref:transcription factor bHLH162-like n=1 Tax=Papaver somniferum TaxID=3469 RepID=UPI000E6F5CF1